MVFSCFSGGEKKGCWNSKRVTHPSSLLIHSIFHHTGKTLASVPGTGAERRRKQCLEFVKKLESFPHVKLRLSSSSSQMSCYRSLMCVCVFFFNIFYTNIKYSHHLSSNNVTNDPHMNECLVSLSLQMCFSIINRLFPVAVNTAGEKNISSQPSGPVMRCCMWVKSSFIAVNTFQ